MIDGIFKLLLVIGIIGGLMYGIFWIIKFGYIDTHF